MWESSEDVDDKKKKKKKKMSKIHLFVFLEEIKKIKFFGLFFFKQ